jgi:hypothetical protein
MTALPQWYGTDSEVVHLMLSRGQFGRTECCYRLRHEIPYKDRVTCHGAEVTCELILDDVFVNPIVERRTALQKRVEEALPRLLEVRARISRASLSEINDDFRNELLKLIDGGQSEPD